MRRNKIPLTSSQAKKAKQGICKNKAITSVLKNYNSCLHEKNIKKEDIFYGPTIFISSIEKNKLPKTLQAYYSLENISFSLDNTHLLKNHEKIGEINEKTPNKNNKIKCVGACGKLYNVSIINTFFHENQRKNMCSNCREQTMINSN